MGATKALIWLVAAMIVMMLVLAAAGGSSLAAMADTVQAPLQAAGQTIRHQASPASFGTTARTVDGHFVVQARVLGRDIDLIQFAMRG